MGMYDNIIGIEVKCPRCGNDDPKVVQIKCGPQRMENYLFGVDKIEVDWSYEYYDAIVDKEKRIIRGVADCDQCKIEEHLVMDKIIKEAKDAGELKCPDGKDFLFECTINGEDALSVLFDRVEKHFGQRYINLFDVALWLNEEDIPIAADLIVKSEEIMS